MDVIAKSGVSLDGIAVLAHGTTVVIDALTKRKGVVGDGAHVDRAPAARDLRPLAGF